MKFSKKDSCFIAHFTFEGSLKDFISSKNSPITYFFQGNPSIKDAIEAIGVPHVEICIIKINEQYSSFSSTLKHDDNVIVFPFSFQVFFKEEMILRSIQSAPHSFILDVHLGSLARSLRMLGIQAMYNNAYSDKTIVQLATDQKHTVLTRDIGLLKHKKLEWGYWVRSQHTEMQLIEVIRHFQLSHLLKPFHICLSCNGNLIPVEKHQILNQLQPLTIAYFDEFFQCNACGKLYWKGSHYSRMLIKLQNLKQTFQQPF